MNESGWILVSQEISTSVWDLVDISLDMVENVEVEGLILNPCGYEVENPLFSLAHAMGENN